MAAEAAWLLLDLGMQEKAAQRDVQAHTREIRARFERQDRNGCLAAAADLAAAEERLQLVREQKAQVASMQSQLSSAETMERMTRLNRTMTQAMERTVRRMDPERATELNERGEEARDALADTVKDMKRAFAPTRAQRRTARDTVQTLEAVLGRERAQMLAAPPTHLPGILPTAPTRVPVPASDNADDDDDFSARLFR